MSSEKLTTQVETLAEDKWTSLTGLADLAAFAIAPASIPLALMLMVGSYAKETHANSKRLSETPMPDDWLQQAADSDTVSKKGLAHLAKCLDEKGFVSVKEAQEWVSIEEREARKQEQQRQRRKNLKGQGAKALLCRAKQECPSMFDLDISRSMERMRQGGKAITTSVDWLSRQIRS